MSRGIDLLLNRWSLSARRAWIEINVLSQPSKHRRVALRKESVDRNVILLAVLLSFILSLSARRAWIEISGVDFSEDWLNGRSPQGERG